MKTTQIKLEFEDEEIPQGVLLQAVQFGLRQQGIFQEDQEIPAQTQITLEKMGKTEEGRFLSYAHVTLPDTEGITHFEQFYELKPEEYLEKRDRLMERLQR